MRIPRPTIRRRPSLRVQVTIGVAAVVMVVVGLAGLTIALRVHDQDLAGIDQDLDSRASMIGSDAGRLLARDHGPGRPPGFGGPAGLGADPPDHDLLAGSHTIVRLLAAGTVVTERGDNPPGPIVFPTSDGLSTIDIAGQKWRSLVRTIDGGRLQVLESLAPVQQRLHAEERLIALVVAAATLAVALAGWLVIGFVLAPLQRLRAGALTIRPWRDGSYRLPEVRGPSEVRELSGTLNEMLGRLQVSMRSTRRFTADAGHELRTPLASLGMDLETLRRNPHLPASQRAEMLAAMTVEHARAVRLLDGLQTLARGDAGALPASGPVDVHGVVDEAVAHSRRRHADIVFRFHSDFGDDAPVVEGWRDGLRRAVDNLLDNAALHGRPAGRVEIRLFPPAPGVVGIRVSDDGPGIPAERREAMKERFTRGPDPRSEGSGLGLALVEQQAALHGGSLHLGEAAGGGLQATFTIRTRPS